MQGAGERKTSWCMQCIMHSTQRTAKVFWKRASELPAAAYKGPFEESHVIDVSMHTARERSTVPFNEHTADRHHSNNQEC
jgi:hypothetical protein